MAAITPHTNLKLLRVPIELDNLNQLTFANSTLQYTYFNSLENKLEVDKFTYQRKDGVIRMPGTLDDLWQYNYVMYQNDGFNNKWMYAQIERMEFVSPGMTDIFIKTDVFQTWQFDLQYNQCFVEREHVSTDTVGLHTVPEGLETGEYVLNGNTTSIGDFSNLSDMLEIVMVSEIAGTISDSAVPASTLNGLPNGYYFLMSPYTNPQTGTISHIYDLAGKADAIGGVFIAPKSIFKYNNTYYYDEKTLTYTSGGTTLSCPVLIPSATTSPATLATTTVTKPTVIGETYTPKNNKLFTYPYTFLNVDNNAGSNTTYHWEDFSTSTANFTIKGTVTPGCSIKLYPTSYKNSDASDNTFAFGLTCAKFPTISWTSDPYTNWLTQNGVNTIISGVESTASSIALMAAGATTGMTGMTAVGGVNAVSAITNTIHQFYVHSIQPDQTKGNVNAGDVVFSSGNTGFTAYPMSIKAEYAQIIDNYFSMFGYKVSVVKVPNITGRANWNYVKTIGSKIHGYIPQEDIRELQSMFDNGVTFWHNPATFLDYTQNNGII